MPGWPAQRTSLKADGAVITNWWGNLFRRPRRGTLVEPGEPGYMGAWVPLVTTDQETYGIEIRSNGRKWDILDIGVGQSEYQPRLWNLRMRRRPIRLPLHVLPGYTVAGRVLGTPFKAWPLYVEVRLYDMEQARRAFQ